jgi:hypothetical protein
VTAFAAEDEAQSDHEDQDPRDDVAEPSGLISEQDLPAQVRN